MQQPPQSNYGTQLKSRRPFIRLSLSQTYIGETSAPNFHSNSVLTRESSAIVKHCSNLSSTLHASDSGRRSRSCAIPKLANTRYHDPLTFIPDHNFICNAQSIMHLNEAKSRIPLPISSDSNESSPQSSGHVQAAETLSPSFSSFDSTNSSQTNPRHPAHMNRCRWQQLKISNSTLQLLASAFLLVIFIAPVLSGTFMPCFPNPTHFSPSNLHPSAFPSVLLFLSEDLLVFFLSLERERKRTKLFPLLIPVSRLCPVSPTSFLLSIENGLPCPSTQPRGSRLPQNAFSCPDMCRPEEQWPWRLVWIRHIHNACNHLIKLALSLWLPVWL